MTADEAFCCGTAAVISPIGSITHDGVKKVYGDGSPGTTTVKLYDALRASRTKPKRTSLGGFTRCPDGAAGDPSQAEYANGGHERHRRHVSTVIGSVLVRWFR